jgi:hypothetical protein
MTDAITLLPVHTAPCYEAFALARQLEHAGIPTQVHRAASEYSVLVSAENADRAYMLV